MEPCYPVLSQRQQANPSPKTSVVHKVLQLAMNDKVEYHIKRDLPHWNEIKKPTISRLLI